jgi:hypothetical protein
MLMLIVAPLATAVIGVADAPTRSSRGRDPPLTS